MSNRAHSTRCGVGIVACALLFLTLFSSTPALSQPKPRIDFDRLISSFPDLPWDFEIRYVVHNRRNTDMLRIYYDARADLVRWRPEYAGSLASVCHGALDDQTMRRLLELLRDRKFNDLPSDNTTLVPVVLNGDATVSVRLGRTIVRKIDRRQRDNAALKQIEAAFDDLVTMIAADPQTKCNMESVPTRP